MFGLHVDDNFCLSMYILPLECLLTPISVKVIRVIRVALWNSSHNINTMLRDFLLAIVRLVVIGVS